MAEYIERGGKNFPTPFSERPNRPLEKGSYRQGWNHCLRAIYQQPAADVKPVVLCRDCEHWQRDWEPVSAPDCRFCGMVDLMTKPDFFCGYGEKQKPAPGTYDLLHEEGGGNLQ